VIEARLTFQHTHYTTILRPLAFEVNTTIDCRKKCVITTASNIGSRVKLGTPLTNDDASGGNDLAPVALDTQTL